MIQVNQKLVDAANDQIKVIRRDIRFSIKQYGEDLRLTTLKRCLKVYTTMTGLANSGYSEAESIARKSERDLRLELKKRGVSV